MPVEIPFFILSLCGALVVLIFHIWLRSKTIENSCLLWISISLLSWSFVGAMTLLRVPLGLNSQTDWLLYAASPISSVLFTMAGFQLVRIRQTFPATNLQLWSKISIITVAALSALASFLLILGFSQSGRYLDAFASTIALAVLGGGLAYSFHSYGHRFLVWVTAMTFLGFVSRQYYVAFYGPPKSAEIIALHLADSTVMIMLFVAVAVSWSFSDSSPLRVVGTPTHVDVVVIVIDLRGSTKWVHYNVDKDFYYVKTFIDDFIRWVMSNAEESALGQPSYVKFLGDGLILIWEIPQDAVSDGAHAGIKLGYGLYKRFPCWVKRNAKRYIWGVPDGVGVGIDVGSAVRLAFENRPNDYLGTTVNLAAKMQEFARPKGGVVIQEKVYKRLNGLRRIFHFRELLKLGDNQIEIRVAKSTPRPASNL